MVAITELPDIKKILDKLIKTKYKQQATEELEIILRRLAGLIEAEDVPVRGSAYYNVCNYGKLLREFGLAERMEDPTGINPNAHRATEYGREVYSTLKEAGYGFH